LFVGEVYGDTEIAQFEVFHKLVIGRESAWRATEFAGVVPVEEFSDAPPFLGARHDGAADSEQGWGLGMPQARRGETTGGLEMEVKTGRMNVLAAMGKSHGDVCFVGTLVVGKSGVAVNAEHGTARRARIGDEMRSNFIQGRREVGDEPQDWLAHAGFPLFFVGLKPVAIIVVLEASEEAEEVGGEVNGHGR